MIRARMNVDSPVRFSLSFNATSWFAQATELELKSLVASQWCWDHQASAAVVLGAAMHDERLAKVLAALAKSGRTIQFTCTVDETHARSWLRRYRWHWAEDEEPQDDVSLPLKQYLSRW